MALCTSASSIKIHGWMKYRIVYESKISGDGINYVVILATLHICTALSYKPTSTASVSFIRSYYMRTETVPLMPRLRLVSRE